MKVYDTCVGVVPGFTRVFVRNRQGSRLLALPRELPTKINRVGVVVHHSTSPKAHDVARIPESGARSIRLYPGSHDLQV